jgi:uncharacterized protein (TIGR00369 family)
LTRDFDASIGTCPNCGSPVIVPLAPVPDPDLEPAVPSPADTPGPGSTADEVADLVADVHPSPFLDHIAPIWWGHDPETGLLTASLRVDTKHLNSRGGLHGGVLSTLADVVLGHAIAATTEPPTLLATASLTVDYIGRAAPGQWLHGRVDSHQLGSTLAFARGTFTADGTPVLHASAVFRVLGRSRNP